MFHSFPGFSLITTNILSQPRFNSQSEKEKWNPSFSWHLLLWLQSSWMLHNVFGCHGRLPAGIKESYGYESCEVNSSLTWPKLGQNDKCPFRVSFHFPFSLPSSLLLSFPLLPLYIFHNKTALIKGTNSHWFIHSPSPPLSISYLCLLNLKLKTIKLKN
jgi:hypothetical protein